MFKMFPSMKYIKLTKFSHSEGTHTEYWHLPLPHLPPPTHTQPMTVKSTEPVIITTLPPPSSSASATKAT